MATTLGQIQQALGGQLYGRRSLEITRIAPLQSAIPGEITFLSNSKYSELLDSTRASCVIVAEDSMNSILPKIAQGMAFIVTERPYHYFAKLTQWWKWLHDELEIQGIHPSAVIDPSAQIDPGASIGALCVIGARTKIGANTRLAARVTVADGVQIGERCIIHSGVVIGADGFGFAPRADRSWEKIEQLGTVRIGNDVEIGANTCIDRGALNDTTIEDGVKIDNLVQIGHNVRIGKHTALAGNAGVAGSANIGAYCTIGGGAVVLGHLNITDDVHVSASTTVMRSIKEPGHYSGIFPIDQNEEWERNASTLKQLHKLRERIRELEKKV